MKKQFFAACELEREYSFPRPEDVEQVQKYAEDTRRKFPNDQVGSYVVYICANKWWKCWEI